MTALFEGEFENYSEKLHDDYINTEYKVNTMQAEEVKRPDVFITCLSQVKIGKHLYHIYNKVKDGAEIIRIKGIGPNIYSVMKLVDIVRHKFAGLYTRIVVFTIPAMFFRAGSDGKKLRRAGIKITLSKEKIGNGEYLLPPRDTEIEPYKEHNHKKFVPFTRGRRRAGNRNRYRRIMDYGTIEV